MSYIFQIFIIALGLAMDAVSVSIAMGIRAHHLSRKEAFRLSSFFGGFQAVMPVLGWLIGSAIHGTISGLANWIAFALLGVIGMKMVIESRSFSDKNFPAHPTNTKLIVLSLATSIDALVVGTTIRLVDIPLQVSAVMIGIVTFVLCYVAYFSGRHLGRVFGDNVEVVGGIILILIGCTFLFP